MVLSKKAKRNVETTITFKKFNLEKEASGTYAVQFSDGHRQQGSLKR